MKLLRYGPPGREKPGILDAEGNIRSLAGVVPDISGDVLSPKGLAKLAKVKTAKLPLVRGNPRVGACVTGVRNFIAVGLNYADHAAESGMPLPKEPVIFNKATTSICGPNDDTMKPKESTKLDYEVKPSPATASPTTSPSVPSRSNVPAANGTRARAARLSARSVPGSSPRARSPTRRSSACGSTSTASAARPAAPRP
jgi:hypothetical protein